MKMQSPLSLAISLLLPALAVCGVMQRSALGEEEAVQFNRDIRPILSTNCFGCHGADANTREADLRLDDGPSALEYGAIVPGNPEESPLWQRITSTDDEMRMPPKDSKKELTAEQIELLKQWIAQGAKYQQHWAFEPPVRPAEPEVQQAQWVRNPIDRFILAQLERQQLAPQADADKQTLIRRVSFALTGLPPTLEEQDRFFNDTSPRAYEDMVERYLNSPRYGEEMARHWLDVARYADTHGLHLDNSRRMWPYRDWVIQAFNDNLSFDQFTIWQLAGDLLPNPTREQLVATGFNRCNVTTSEGGAIAEEFLYRYAVDRASTAMEAWMGLTGGCAVCHDHKYDPLTAKEFYSMYAFFYSAADPAMDGNIDNTNPYLKLPSPEQQKALDAAQAAEREARALLNQAASAARYTDPAEQQPAPAPYLVTDVLFDDYFPAGMPVRNTSRNPSVWDDEPEFGAPAGRRVLRQENSYFHEEVIQSQLVPWIVPQSARFQIWLRIDPLDPPRAVAIEVSGPGGAKRLQWGAVDGFPPSEGAPPETIDKGPLPMPGQWAQLAWSADELKLEPGQRINSLSLQEAGGIVWWDALTVSGTVEPASDPRASLLAWWKTHGTKAPPGLPGHLHGVFGLGPDKFAEAEEQQRSALRQFYLATIARPVTQQLAIQQAAFASARAAHQAADDAIPGTMIFRNTDQPRDAFVMLRGQYDKPGEKVEPGVPAVFAPLPAKEGLATRLDLAHWLVAPEHPLTARVTVNRFWQQLMGTGIVKTSFDFGTQGELPSHPELLDWLAIEFRDSGWDVKHIVRLIVNSSTFRQSSQTSESLRQLDPENRLYARGPRFRLDAEQIRDNVLHAAGIIDLTIGGPGVKTYQPPNIWEPVGYSDSNTRYYLQDHGSALYRRSIYSFLKRTAPPPFMTNFDGPNREQFCTRRERSNTPLQALQLMNDQQHFEAARALAERILSAGSMDDAQRIGLLYRTVLARLPDEEETKLVADLLIKQRELFAAEPASAARAIEVGESEPQRVASDVETAAWTLVANLVLNLDETLTRN